MPGPILWIKKERVFRIPFWMCPIGTRYSFSRAGSTVKDPHFSAITDMARHEQILLERSWTLRLLIRVSRMSDGPIAWAIRPNVSMAWFFILLFFELKKSSKSIASLIHSFGETDWISSESVWQIFAIRVTRASWTSWFLFLSKGVKEGMKIEAWGWIWSRLRKLTIWSNP